jgi:hypothetical protein
MHLRRYRLQPGIYRSEEAVTICLMQDGVRKETTSYGPGARIEIPPTHNRHWFAAEWLEDVDKRPTLELVAD